MGSFKKFLGLGNIQNKIDQIPVSGTFNTTDYTVSSPEGYIGDPNFMTKMNDTVYEIPNIEKTGRIAVLLTKRNPIFVKLTDGTEAFFSYDEYKEIQGEPALGKTMTIVFQRNINDKSNNVSKIESAKVLD